MFDRAQIDNLYYLVEKGVITQEDANKFLQKKLVEIGFEVTPPPAPEVPAEAPAEVVPPTPEAPAEGQPAA